VESGVTQQTESRASIYFGVEAKSTPVHQGLNRQFSWIVIELLGVAGKSLLMIKYNNHETDWMTICPLVKIYIPGKSKDV
jgi:hypothetical protein